MPQNTAISRKQEMFLASLLSLPTLRAACSASGISEDTGQRWLKLPEVKTAYEDLKQEYVNASLTALLKHADKAIETLARHMTDSDTQPAQQIRAAQLLLEQVIDLHKMSELEQKIAKLEQLIQERTT